MTLRQSQARDPPAAAPWSAHPVRHLAVAALFVLPSFAFSLSEDPLSGWSVGNRHQFISLVLPLAPGAILNVLLFCVGLGSSADLQGSSVHGPGWGGGFA